MNKVDIIDAQIERLMVERQQAAEAAAERVARYGDEPEADGSVITWRMRFHKKVTEYRYAAIKSCGVWYVTGPTVPEGYSWDELTAWLDEAHKVYGFKVLS